MTRLPARGSFVLLCRGSLLVGVCDMLRFASVIFDLKSHFPIEQAGIGEDDDEEVWEAGSAGDEISEDAALSAAEKEQGREETPEWARVPTDAGGKPAADLV